MRQIVTEDERRLGRHKSCLKLKVLFKANQYRKVSFDNFQARPFLIRCETQRESERTFGEIANFAAACVKRGHGGKEGNGVKLRAQTAKGGALLSIARNQIT